MASTIDLSDLEHYIKVVEKYGQMLKDFREAMIELCEDASEYAQQQYAEYGHSNINVSFEPHGNMAIISAKFAGSSEKSPIAFFEFGTGEVGRGTYPSEAYLPSSGVPITGNWEYYYKSEHKGVKNGVKGWFLDEEHTIFLKGNKAEAEMWRTAEYIRRKAHIIISKHFQKESGAV
jgi:hypothetical protein